MTTDNDAVRTAMRAWHSPRAANQEKYCEHCAAAVAAARPVHESEYVNRLVAAIEYSAPGNGIEAELWYDVAEFIRRRPHLREPE